MRKNIVISIAMNKGGTGKSSTVANLAFALSQMNYRVLAIEADPQMNLSRSFNFFTDTKVPLEQRKNFYNAFINEEDIRKHIMKTSYENIDLVMGDIALTNIEIKMSQMMFRELRVKDILEPALTDEENGYDFILIDHNSSLGLFNTSILHASNEIIIPLEPSIYSIEGLGTIMGHVEKIQKYNKRLNLQDVHVLGILFNRVDKRENISGDTKQLVEELFPNKTFKTYIPTDTNIKNAQWDGMLLGAYDKRSRAVSHYNELAEEVISVVEERYKQS